MYFWRTGGTLLCAYSGRTVPEEQFTRKYSFFLKEHKFELWREGFQGKEKMNKKVIQEGECQLRFGKKGKKKNQKTNCNTGGLWHVVLTVCRMASL